MIASIVKPITPYVVCPFPPCVMRDSVQWGQADIEEDAMGTILIVHGSKYGASKRYADECARRLRTSAIRFKDCADTALRRADVVIYFGPVFAGGMPGLRRTMKRVAALPRPPRVIIVTVGLGDPSLPGNTEHLRGIVRQQVPPSIADVAECFHLRGGIDYTRLSLMHRIMMWMMYQHEKRIPRDQWTTDTRMFNETYGGAVDMVDFRTLTPIMAALDVAD